MFRKCNSPSSLICSGFRTALILFQVFFNSFYYLHVCDISKCLWYNHTLADVISTTMLLIESWPASSSSSVSLASPLCFSVNHMFLWSVAPGVCWVILPILQSERASDRVEHRAGRSSGVKNVTSCAFFSQITGAIPITPRPFFFSSSPFLFFVFLLFLSLSVPFCFSFYWVDFTFRGTLL